MKRPWVWKNYDNSNNTTTTTVKFKLYSIHFQVGKNVDKWLWMLSAVRIMSRSEGDCDVVKSRNGSIQADFQVWKDDFLRRLQALAKGEKMCSCECKKGSCKNKKKHHEEEEGEKYSSEARPYNLCCHGNSTVLLFMALVCKWISSSEWNISVLQSHLGTPVCSMAFLLSVYSKTPDYLAWVESGHFISS